MWKRKLTSIQCAKCRRRLMIRRYEPRTRGQIFDRGKWRKGRHKAKKYVCVRCRHGGKQMVYTTLGYA